jgi:bifunctional non-homologous end joining protein LigD
MRIWRVPAGFVVPAQPIKASKPPSGPDWVHEIKHDGYRLIVHRDGPALHPQRLRLDNAAARDRGSCTADQGQELHDRRRSGGAGGPDGLSRFDDLRRRDAARTAVLYAFDLIEHDGQDMRDLPFVDRKAALAWLLRDTKAGILLNEHVAVDGATVFTHACRLGVEAGRRHLSVRSVPGLDQGPESGQHRCAAGA